MKKQTISIILSISLIVVLISAQIISDVTKPDISKDLNQEIKTFWINKCGEAIHYYTLKTMGEELYIDNFKIGRCDIMKTILGTKPFLISSNRTAEKEKCEYVYVGEIINMTMIDKKVCKKIYTDEDLVEQFVINFAKLIYEQEKLKEYSILDGYVNKTRDWNVAR